MRRNKCLALDALRFSGGFEIEIESHVKKTPASSNLIYLSSGYNGHLNAPLVMTTKETKTLIENLNKHLEMLNEQD